MENSPKVSPNDFEIVRFVGKGGFGTVFQVNIEILCNIQVKKIGSSNVYCMKAIEKDQVAE